MTGVWTAARANEWAAARPWVVGCNYFPASAVNPIEMWRGETFGRAGITRELGWAAGIGMNAVRTNLHLFVWREDPDGLVKRIGEFLAIAAERKIAVVLNFFDDCMHSGKQPQPGRQADPVPGVHNSRWVPSPDHPAVTDRTRWPELEAFVRGVIRPFARDPRVLGWDLYNEPGNGGLGEASLGLVEACFGWARAEAPDQPLTMGVWTGDTPKLNAAMLDLSDVVSFHNYDPLDRFAAQAADLKRRGRPVWCTEWMARTRGSEVATHLPWMKREGIGAFNWGFVSGRTQTIYPWGSKPGDPEPPVWFHDLLRPDGAPYRAEEIAVFRREAGRT